MLSFNDCASLFFSSPLATFILSSYSLVNLAILRINKLLWLSNVQVWFDKSKCHTVFLVFVFFHLFFLIIPSSIIYTCIATFWRRRRELFQWFWLFTCWTSFYIIFHFTNIICQYFFKYISYIWILYTIIKKNIYSKTKLFKNKIHHKYVSRKIVRASFFNY